MLLYNYIHVFEYLCVCKLVYLYFLFSDFAVVWSKQMLSSENENESTDNAEKVASSQRKHKYRPRWRDCPAGNTNAAKIQMLHKYGTEI